MKREIICQDCVAKYPNLFKEGEPYPKEHRKNIKGIAKGKYHCDFCDDTINPGDDCHAVSTWADYGGRLYYEWEDEFIIRPMLFIPSDNKGASDEDFNALMGFIKTQFKRDEPGKV